MHPYIIVFGHKLSSFSFIIALATMVFFLILEAELRRRSNSKSEELYILPKLAYSAIIALPFSATCDALFKIPQNQGIVFSGITFYGGLAGFTLCLFVQLKYTKNCSTYSVEQWFNIITLPIIAFHMIGRIGCFFSGCCYGKVTTSILGVRFPDNFESGIFHYGYSCYPTQLFEAICLAVIFCLVYKSEHRFRLYLLSYAIARFFIEFFRGDNRGIMLFRLLSPAQIISIIIIAVCITQYLSKTAKCRKPFN